METRVDFIFQQEMEGDTSFTEKASFLEMLFGKEHYSTPEVREIWHRGVKHGIRIGLIKAGLEGQRIELLNNTMNDKHREFIEKLYELCDDYSCYVQYHPLLGMTIISKEK